MLRQHASRELQFALSVFRDGLEDGGCLICRAVARVEQRALFAFLYEGITAPDVMAKFVEGGGFCPQHFWRVMNIGINRWSVGQVEMATLCSQVILRAVEELLGRKRYRRQQGRFSLGGPEGKQTAIFPGRKCVFCHERHDREQSLVELLETVVEQEEFERVVTTQGLCLQHALIALTSWKRRDRVDWLSEIIRARSDKLILDLHSFLRKYDERFRDEPFGLEIDAVQRAAHFLAGLDLSRPEPEGRGSLAAGARGKEASRAE
jgi:Family of unknown function (DUF6062)